MRVVYTLIVLIAVLVWGGVQMRGQSRDVAGVLFGFAALLALLLGGSIAGLF